MAYVEKIYPLHLLENEKHFLLKHLEVWIKNLWESGPEGVRQSRFLSPVLERLKTQKGEDKVLYEILVKEALKREKVKNNRYVSLRISKRTYQIIQLDLNLLEFNPNNAMYGSPDLYDQTIVMQSAKPVTKNLQYGEMCKVYTFLALGFEMPDNLKKFLLTENED